VQNPSLCRLAYVAVPVRAGVFATLLEYPGSPVKGAGMGARRDDLSPLHARRYSFRYQLYAQLQFTE
jgi:hypothetical protein